MKDPATAHRRRGAPFTFDAKAMLDLVERIRAVPAQDVLCAGFDHAVGDPVPDEHMIPAHAQVVVFEGLYLHTAATTAQVDNDDPDLAAYDNHDRVWAAIAAHMNERWWTDVSITTATTRLARRHVATGLANDLDAGLRRVEVNDGRNAEWILAHRNASDVDVVVSNI
ncbi:hypothetical protein AMAG_09559 [Allomyces macrogynus ATCC 38327]|uniref:Phosphoribulokinase/uridine kinase domain-containing protein n=1 Tax=Allomyces macrogynus (strain ATCC 38327) TaxID=578462 RepID=A0A0L0ST72_ALLM3|nr:hypothetical protein AMAG_09559 [Allomyces macrogynus ATCC 38327]|eukprot:KNE65580.1 hypothetical protein AMAG_09559 [Allomyces macrogynus ATCC 38327]